MPNLLSPQLTYFRISTPHTPETFVLVRTATCGRLSACHALMKWHFLLQMRGALHRHQIFGQQIIGLLRSASVVVVGSHIREIHSPAITPKTPGRTCLGYKIEDLVQFEGGSSYPAAAVIMRLRHNEGVVDRIFLKAHHLREPQTGQDLHVENLFDRCLEF